MTIYVDELVDYGWIMRGRRVASCHMFSSEVDLTSLHEMALAIGMKRQWFQEHKIAPHYDLVQSRRDLAISLGVIPVTRRQASEIWKLRREKLTSL